VSVKRFEIKLAVRPAGLFLVGESTPTSAFVDVSFNKVIRSTGGEEGGGEEYVINGSSFKGWLRSAITRISKELLNIDTCKYDDCGYCTVCRIFGFSGNGGKSMLVVSNFHPESKPETVALTHVSLSSKTLTTREHALYSVEYVTPETTFVGYLQIENRDSDSFLHDLKTILAGLSFLRSDRAGRHGVVDVKIMNGDALRKEVQMDEETQILLSNLEKWGWDI